MDFTDDELHTLTVALKNRIDFLEECLDQTPGDASYAYMAGAAAALLNKITRRAL